MLALSLLFQGGNFVSHLSRGQEACDIWLALGDKPVSGAASCIVSANTTELIYMLTTFAICLLFHSTNTCWVRQPVTVWWTPAGLFPSRLVTGGYYSLWLTYLSGCIFAVAGMWRRRGTRLEMFSGRRKAQNHAAPVCRFPAAWPLGNSEAA